jgi:hypothetical protein
MPLIVLKFVSTARRCSRSSLRRVSGMVRLFFLTQCRQKVYSERDRQDELWRDFRWDGNTSAD